MPGGTFPSDWMPVSVFLAAALSEGRPGLPTVMGLWRAPPHLLLPEGRRRLPPMARRWCVPPHLLLPEGRRRLPTVARPGRALHLLPRYQLDPVKQICQRRILSILAVS